jgi:hypothetical protein
MISIRIVSYNNPKHTINAVQSILDSEIDMPYEILVFENGDRKYEDHFLNYLHKNFGKHIQYMFGYGNIGFCKAIGFLHQQSNPETKYIVEMSEDMFFHPLALRNLLECLRNSPQIGLASANMVNGALYPKHDPQPEHIVGFADRYKTLPPQKLAVGLSNMPWMMSIDFYNKMRQTDVWSDAPPLPFNKYPGIWDESICPLSAWTGDWDCEVRAKSLLEVALVENAMVYHYDHVASSKLDREQPAWVVPAEYNYILKHGKLDKYVKFQKKHFPVGRYPQR